MKPSEEIAAILANSQDVPDNHKPQGILYMAVDAVPANRLAIRRLAEILDELVAEKG